MRCMDIQNKTGICIAAENGRTASTLPAAISRAVISRHSHPTPAGVIPHHQRLASTYHLCRTDGRRENEAPRTGSHDWYRGYAQAKSMGYARCPTCSPTSALGWPARRNADFKRSDLAQELSPQYENRMRPQGNLCMSWPQGIDVSRCSQLQ